METVLLIVVLIVMMVGLAGTILPMLPGAPIILVAALVYGMFTEFAVVNANTLIWLTVLTGVSLVVDWVAQVYGVKRMGGSWGGIVGSIVGMVVGLMIPGVNVIGFVLGAFIGAVLGEVAVGRRSREAWRAGLGSSIGFVVGGVGKFVIGLVMVGMFIWRVAA